MFPSRIIYGLFCLLFVFACKEAKQLEQEEAISISRTLVEIKGKQFYINGEPTYAGKSWQGNSIEGLLFNARLVQGIFDDENPETRERWKYPDTKRWNPDRNTAEFVAAMPAWKAHGLLAFTINLQGGSPMGYGNKNWHNSAFDSLGNLKQAYYTRLEKILNKADELEMAVILGLFYFGQDQFLKDEKAILNAVDNVMDWLFEKGYQNVLIEVNNECDLTDLYEHSILETPRVHELMQRIKAKEKEEFRFLVSTSFKGATVPSSNVIAQADFLLLHGNGVEDPSYITEMISQTKADSSYRTMPILFNEDDHYNFDKSDNNLFRAIKGYASWGYFDFRREGEAFENGFQSVPVDWRINSERKKAFFGKLKKITD